MPNPKIDKVSRLLYRRTPMTATQTVTNKIKPAKIVIESVSFKAPHSAKVQQNWRYPGGQIVRAPSLLIGSQRYEDHKDAGYARRKQESNFFLTLNTNKPMVNRNGSSVAPEYSDVAFEALRNTLDEMSTDRVLSQVLKFGPKVTDEMGLNRYQDYRNDKYADVIQSVEWKASVETGDVAHRLHAHIWLTVHHYSQVQVNIQMFQHVARRIYNSKLPEGDKFEPLRMRTLPYVYVKPLPQSNWTEIMKQYIRKGMMS